MFRLPLKFVIPLSLALTAATAFAVDTDVLPQADTYLRANQATSAFGTVATIEANNANGVRVMLLRFDVSAIAKPITHLRLTLTAVAGSAGNIFNVYGLKSGESWAESSVTWVTGPGVNHSFTGLTGNVADYLNTAELTSSLASYTSAATGLVTAFDVTSGALLDFVNNDADGVVSFLLAEADPTDTPGDRYNAREATTGQPVLTVTNAVTTPPPDPTPPPQVIRVVLVSGQSNADGRAPGSGLPAVLQAPQANVPFYYYTNGAAANSDGTLGTLSTLRPGATEFPAGGFGPEVALGAMLSPVIEQQPGARLAIIKYAKGGSNLYSDWKPGGDATTTGDGTYYARFQTVVRNGLAKLRAANPGVPVVLAGMIWVQGESDIDGGAATSAAYGANLTTFISDVRQTFCPTLPFFFSRISSSQTVYSSPADPDYPNYLTIRDQQAQVAANVRGAYMVDADGAAFTMNSDFLHFNTGGQQAMGTAFATAMAPILRLRVGTLESASAGGGVHLAWNAVPGKRYRVYQSQNLIDWTASTLGAVSEWTDTASTGHSFYRVEELDDTLP